MLAYLYIYSYVVVRLIINLNRCKIFKNKGYKVTVNQFSIAHIGVDVV